MGEKVLYEDILAKRYTAPSMAKLFSDDFKYSTWRRCWIALAESEKELGLNITDEMIKELKASKDNINYEDAEKKEHEIRHDVMAHVYAYGLQCPKAKGIIHLGATSQFVVCNTELIQMKEAIALIKKDMINVISNLTKKAYQLKATPTLGFTHFQPAQPTTIGKRLTLYIYDLIHDLKNLENAESMIHARGAKGTTGTQASYLELLGDYEKVKKLDKLVSKKLGFDESYKVTAQTYSRKIDSIVCKALSSIAESAHKFAVDMRLMSHMKIADEPFEKNQTGSSAMAYKKNPMRSERMTSLSRKLIDLQMDISHTYSNQWLERTLDDSAIRRLSIPQMFMLTNAILRLYSNITNGMVFYEKRMLVQLNEEIQFMATEKILMHLAKKGKSRQEMHEKIKIHSTVVAENIKKHGKENDLFERIKNDKEIDIDPSFLDSLISNASQFCGVAEKQTIEFLADESQVILDKHNSDKEQNTPDIDV